MAFPVSPSDGQTYLNNGVTYVYNAGMGVWDIQGASSTSSVVSSVAGRVGTVTLTAADIGAGTFPGALTITSANVTTANVTTLNLSNALTLASTLTVNNTLSVSGASNVAALAATSGTYSSTLSVTGAVTLGAALSVGGSAIVTGTTQLSSLGVGTTASGTGGEVRATGAITAGYSDERLKTKVRRIDNALAKVRRLSGVYYVNNEIAKSYGFTDESQQVGYLAGQMNGELPEVVKPAPFDIAKDESGNEYSMSGQNYMTVQYEKVGPLLLEAIKDLADELDIIKNHLGL